MGRSVPGAPALGVAALEEIGHRNLERLGNVYQGLEVRRALTALDHREKRDRDAGALGKVFLRDATIAPVHPQLANSLSQLSNDVHGVISNPEMALIQSPGGLDTSAVPERQTTGSEA
jgi:hypothetical protein